MATHATRSPGNVRVVARGPPQPTIDPYFGLLDSATSERASAYLSSGVPLMGTTQMVPDVVTGSPAAVVPISTVTDGE